MHDKAQMAQHQIAGGIQILIKVEALGQSPLFLNRQHRHAADSANVGIKIVARYANGECLKRL